jgi:hypothetical protein
VIINLHFDRPTLEREAIRDRYDLLLGVVGTLRLLTWDKLLYEEPMFPIVELRVQLATWLQTGFHNNRAFEFQSMESDEAGLVWIRRQNDGWRIGAKHQVRVETRVFSDDQIKSASCRFIDTVDSWLRSEWDIEVSAYV